MAASTASTPASTAASTVAAAMPDVSWVWKVDRQVDLFFQRFHEDLGSLRLQQAGHVLDAKDMGAGSFQFLRQIDIVFQIEYFGRALSSMSPV
jgi:hypothetical protein